MKVRAIRLGYYKNKRRFEGQVFDIKEEKEFSKEWMEKLEAEAKAPKKSKKASPAKKDAVDLNEDVI